MSHPASAVSIVSMLALAAAGLLGACMPARAAEPAKRHVVGYFAEWNDAYKADAIPADLVTHINYSFARVKDGEIALSVPAAADAAKEHASVKHFAALRALKAKHPQLKTLISVGGWGASKGFGPAAADEAARQKFGRSCAAFAHANGFDGIDIDWEFPGEDKPEDTHNFTLLLAEIRTQLDAQAALDGHPYLLTIATSAGPAHYEVLELAEIQKSLDFINIMGYDLNGGWSANTDFNASLFAPAAKGDAAPNTALSVDAAVRAYLAAGVANEKIVVGVPFYGQAWGGVGPANDGLFQPHDKSAPKPAPGADWTYRTIRQLKLDEGDRRHWNDTAKVPWLYDPKTRIMISYDDAESLKAKGDYVRQNHLAGVMIWELSQDDDQSTLLRALVAGMREAS